MPRSKSSIKPLKSLKYTCSDGVGVAAKVMRMPTRWLMERADRKKKEERERILRERRKSAGA